MNPTPQDLVAFGDQYDWPEQDWPGGLRNTLTALPGPSLRLSYGALAVADPWWPEKLAPRSVLGMGAGEYPVVVSTLAFPRDGKPDEALPCAVTVGAPDRATQWHPMIRDGADYYFEVDTGLGAFYDLADTHILETLSRDDEYMLGVFRDTMDRTVSSIEVDGRVVAVVFRCSDGDEFPAYGGFTPDGKPVALLVDLQLLDGTARRVEPHETSPAPDSAPVPPSMGSAVAPVPSPADEPAPADLVAFGDQYEWPSGQRATMTAMPGPRLRLSYGAVAVADPGWPEKLAPYAISGFGGAGEFPVMLSTLAFPREGLPDEVVPCAAAIGNLDLVTAWYPVLGAKGRHFLEVNTGLAAFYDLADTHIMETLASDEEFMRGLLRDTVEKSMTTIVVDGRVAGVAFRCGDGEAFPTYHGFGRDGGAEALLVDLQLLDGTQSRLGSRPD